jgi:hypothetical protein
VDIDRFFTLGPGAPFQANEVFTNRELYVAAYRERLLAHCGQSWDVARLMDFQRPARNVMAVIGEGGIGKSTLVRHLARLSVEGELADVSGECAAALVDFADVANRSFETVLLRVRAALGGLGRSWSAFDVALALYWERKHPGESLVTFLRRSSSIGEASDALRASEQITTAVDTLLGGFGAVSLAVRLTELATQTAAKTRALRRLRQDLPAFEAVIEERDPDKMLGYLPVLLAYDLERMRSRRPVIPLCLLDTFETVQVLPPERRGLEDLVSRLVYLMPNVFFVAGSRRPLRWHDPVRSVGLTYGGELRWPGLADAGGSSDQFPVDGFDEASAEEYLRTRLTRDGQPAIPWQIRQRIVAGGGGSPHYLELSAELFEQVASRGAEPAVDEFGRPFPELVLRVMRDLSVEDRDLLRAAALLEAFDEEILTAVLPDVRARRIEEFLRRGFIRHDPGVWPPCRLHENLRHGVNTCDDHTPDGWTKAERCRNLLRATTFLADVALATWDEEPSLAVPPSEASRRSVAAFLLALHAANEHGVLPPRLGHMAYTVRELGHWQVLGSLPDYAESGHSALAGLAAVAKLATAADVDAGVRYEQLKRARGQLPDDTYSSYAHFELGNLAFFAGELDQADRYFTMIAGEESVLGSGALFGLAGNALRRSRFREVESYMRRPSDARLEQARVADMLGHLAMHNGSFERAAALFADTLNHAKQAAAPLWIGRALRHLALACMWFDPARALALVPEGRELNLSLGDGVGIAQCDMAAALAHAFRGQWADAERHVAEARAGLAAVGATFEMLPVDPIDVLVHLGQGRVTEARAVTRRLIDDAQRGRPHGPPVWSAVTALWVERPDWSDFYLIDWLEPETARDRWAAPAARLTSLGLDGG